MRSRSLIVVNFRSAALTREAVATARAASSSPLQVVVIDNSGDPAEAERLRETDADELLIADRNLGYGTAINRARRSCTGGLLLLANPDLRFAPRSIDRLAEEIERGAAVAGPKLTWDDAGEWLLPPADELTAPAMGSAALAGRIGFWRELRDRAAVRRRVAFWSLDVTTERQALSGAMLAVDAAAFDRVGGFDERYFLYFEEHDLLRRIRHGGGAVRYVPEALCRHLYNQSAGSSAGEHYAASEARFLATWMGEGLTALIRRIGAPLPPRALTPGASADVLETLGIDPAEVMVEASPLASFATAAGYVLHGRRIAVPQEIVASYRDEALYLRVVRRRDGATLAAWRARSVGLE